MVVVVRVVPWWGVVSSAAAPVLLVGGWTVAAGLQPRSFNAVTSTISALAADGAADRWVMTLAFAAAGACEIVTGLALRPAALAGRLILVTGGAAGLLVAASPEPAGGGGSLAAYRTGLKDARLELDGFPFIHVEYARNAWQGMFESALSVIAPRLFVRQDLGFNTGDRMALNISWV